MNLLVITQKVDINDDNLGFFCGWLEKFAAKLGRVYVICLADGKHSLPKNVTVLSLGKDKGASKLLQFLRLQLYLVRYLRNVNGVFAHMCPIYAIYAFPFSKIFGKKIFLWYVHKSQNPTLWIAEKAVDGVITASKESFRVKSKKVSITGHGIDTRMFAPAVSRNREYKIPFNIVTAGRITPSKDIETLLEAFHIVTEGKNRKDCTFTIIGSPPIGKFYDYLERLKNISRARNISRLVEFKGGVPHSKMPLLLSQGDLFIHASRTGSIDKVVLEAMACGVLVVSSSEAFRSMLSSIDSNLCFKEGNAPGLAKSIEYVRELDDFQYSRISFSLRKAVRDEHNLDALIERIISRFP
jgi:glycosyltransferase involved in cell wall biosynthesis